VHPLATSYHPTLLQLAASSRQPTPDEPCLGEILSPAGAPKAQQHAREKVLSSEMERGEERVCNFMPLPRAASSSDGRAHAPGSCACGLVTSEPRRRHGTRLFCLGQARQARLSHRVTPTTLPWRFGCHASHGRWGPETHKLAKCPVAQHGTAWRNMDSNHRHIRAGPVEGCAVQLPTANCQLSNPCPLVYTK
jgi:hypothetical protein